MAVSDDKPISGPVSPNIPAWPDRVEEPDFDEPDEFEEDEDEDWDDPDDGDDEPEPAPDAEVPRPVPHFGTFIGHPESKDDPELLALVELLKRYRTGRGVIKRLKKVYPDGSSSGGGFKLCYMLRNWVVKTDNNGKTAGPHVANEPELWLRLTPHERKFYAEIAYAFVWGHIQRRMPSDTGPCVDERCYPTEWASRGLSDTGRGGTRNHVHVPDPDCPGGIRPVVYDYGYSGRC